MVRQTWGGNTLDVIYDNNSKPCELNYNGTLYYYVLNLQGDVIAIVSENGTCVAKYTYDAWGNVISQSGTLAAVNPIRYRGYYYDSETGLYYLGSRYYDPVVKRFINADGAAFATINPYSNGLTDKNYFAYCDNNPTSRSDDGGQFWNIVAGAVFGGLVSGITSAYSSYTDTGKIDWGDVAISATVGAVTGGVAASGLGPVAQAGVSALASASGSVASSWRTHTGKWTAKAVAKAAGKAALNGAVGAIASIAGSALGKTTSGLAAKGENAVFRVKRGIGCFTKRQAKNLVRYGRKMINTARGISSVMGTAATWRFSTVSNYLISKW